MNVQAVERELRAAPGLNPATLIVHQGQALKLLERARKQNLAAHGKPLCIRQVAEAELLDAIAVVEEFDALTLEAL
jgi:hypothetical protein